MHLCRISEKAERCKDPAKQQVLQGKLVKLLQRVAQQQRDAEPVQQKPVQTTVKTAITFKASGGSGSKMPKLVGVLQLHGCAPMYMIATSMRVRTCVLPVCSAACYALLAGAGISKPVALTAEELRRRQQRQQRFLGAGGMADGAQQGPSQVCEHRHTHTHTHTHTRTHTHTSAKLRQGSRHTYTHKRNCCYSEAIF